MKSKLINPETKLFILNNFTSSKTTNKTKIIDRYYNYIQKAKTIIKKNKYFFSYLISYFLYFISLEKCYEGEDVCCVKGIWIRVKIVELMISCLILSYLLQLIIFKISSKLNLVHIFIVFLLFYLYSHSYYFHDHGYYNLIAYFLFLIIFLIIILISKGLFHLFKKNYYFFIIFCIITLCFYFSFLAINPVNCNDWAKGLNDTYIENDVNKYGCHIKIPKNCLYKILKYTQDFTRIKGIQCQNIKKNAKKKYLSLSKSQYLSEETKKIGLPLTNKDPVCFLDSVDDSAIMKYFLGNLIDVDNKNIINKNISEIIIDFSKNEFGEMIINVNYNETLSKERKKLENNSIPFSDNIMIIYLDSVSRANAIRQLKKTMNFFEKFISYKGGFHEKYPTENYHSFQFFKYHSFMEHTRGNYPRLFYGKERNNTILVRITKYLKENGYITSYSGDLCMRDNTRTLHNLTIDEVEDHQMLLCDPNKDDFNQFTIKCLYGKIHTEHLLEYTNQFWRKYKNNRKYSLILTNDAHEGSLESLKYLDNLIFNYLDSLYNDNLLKESSVFLLSDHGVGMPSIYYTTYFYRCEEQLPMLYIIINDRKNISFNEQYLNIYENQQAFITAYDIYNTIANLIFGNEYEYIRNQTIDNDTPKSPYGKSLFEKIDKKKRSSKNYLNMAQYVCI